MQKTLDSTPDIIFDHVSKTFPSTGKPGIVDVSFAIRKGSFVSFVGSSGSGKTTSLRIIAGLEKQTEGNVTVPDKIAMVFQNAALFPWATAIENVMFGLKMRGEEDGPSREKAQKYLTMLGLANYADVYPRLLSGGQRQRVGIARALAVEPPVLLLDEPFSALDEDVRMELSEDVLRIWHETGITIVMVSHQLDEAVALSQQVIVMKNFVVAGVFDVPLPYPRSTDSIELREMVSKIRSVYRGERQS